LSAWHYEGTKTMNVQDKHIIHSMVYFFSFRTKCYSYKKREGEREKSASNVDELSHCFSQWTINITHRFDRIFYWHLMQNSQFCGGDDRLSYLFFLI